MPCQNVLVSYQENLHHAARSWLYMDGAVLTRTLQHASHDKLPPVHASCVRVDTRRADSLW